MESRWRCWKGQQAAAGFFAALLAAVMAPLEGFIISDRKRPGRSPRTDIWAETSWSQIGLPQHCGTISVDTTDPSRSNSENMFTALLAEEIQTLAWEKHGFRTGSYLVPEGSDTENLPGAAASLISAFQAARNF